MNDRLYQQPLWQIGFTIAILSTINQQKKSTLICALIKILCPVKWPSKANASIKARARAKVEAEVAASMLFSQERRKLHQSLADPASLSFLQSIPHLRKILNKRADARAANTQAIAAAKASNTGMPKGQLQKIPKQLPKNYASKRSSKQRTSALLALLRKDAPAYDTPEDFMVAHPSLPPELHPALEVLWGRVSRELKLETQ